MAELIGCRECDSPSCKGCNIKILADMLKQGKLNALMNKNRCINGSVDAVPVVSGHWNYKCPVDGKSYRYCSECLEIIYDCNPPVSRNYCPNCGAKMDGGNNAKE